MARRAPDAVLALDEATGPGGDLEQFVRHLAWAKQVGVHGYRPTLTSWSLCWYVGVHGCSCEGGVRGVGLKHVYTPTCLQATHTNLRFALVIATHSMQTKAGDKHSCHGTMTCRLASPSLCPKVIADITDITTSRTSRTSRHHGHQLRDRSVVNKLINMCGNPGTGWPTPSMPTTSPPAANAGHWGGAPRIVNTMRRACLPALPTMATV